MKKVLGVIPARWQSSRFPGKPLSDILGKSLIQRTYENASRCKSLDALVIATDDRRIFEHAAQFGADVRMTSTSCATGTDRTWEIAQEFPDAEFIVNIQGDEPCLDPHVVDQLVVKIKEQPDAAMTTPISPLFDREAALKPNIVKCVFDRRGRALYFSRSPIPYAQRADHTPQYYRHIGVYCFRREALRQYVQLDRSPLQESEDLEQLKMVENGLQIHVCIVDDQAAGVDTPADVKTVERILCQKENIYLSPGELSPR